MPTHQPGIISGWLFFNLRHSQPNFQENVVLILLPLGLFSITEPNSWEAAQHSGWVRTLEPDCQGSTPNSLINYSCNHGDSYAPMSQFPGCLSRMMIDDDDDGDDGGGGGISLYRLVGRMDWVKIQVFKNSVWHSINITDTFLYVPQEIHLKLN